MNESCPTYEWVVSHIWMSHVPHMNESCPTYEWVMSHTLMSHVGHMEKSMNESCLTYKSVMSRICRTRMSHVSHIKKWCDTYEWVLVRIIYTWDMTHSLRHMRDMTHAIHINELSYTWFLRETWLMQYIWMSTLAHDLYVRHDSFICDICETWLMQYTYQ